MRRSAKSLTSARFRPVSPGRQERKDKMAKNGIYLGIVALFCVLCGIAESLSVPIVYGVFPMFILLLGAVLVLTEKENV